MAAESISGHKGHSPGTHCPPVLWLLTKGGLCSLPAPRLLSELPHNQTPHDPRCPHSWFTEGKAWRVTGPPGQAPKSAQASRSLSPKQVSSACHVSLMLFKCWGSSVKVWLVPRGGRGHRFEARGHLVLS